MMVLRGTRRIIGVFALICVIGGIVNYKIDPDLLPGGIVLLVAWIALYGLEVYLSKQPRERDESASGK